RSGPLPLAGRGYPGGRERLSRDQGDGPRRAGTRRAASMTMSDAVLGADLMRRATESDCCGGPDRDLLTLLREDASIYAGRGAIEAERLRAFVMECVSRAGLAPEALPF